MNILTKVGQQDNIVTYEHVCDTKADMANIEKRYITLGTVCIVLTGESEGLEVYMADSKREWHDLVAGVSGSCAGAGGGLEIHLCAQSEVDENGLPDIEYPLDTVLYLVPSGEDSGNLYNEYIYVNEEWEPFGSAQTTVDLSGYALKTDTVLETTLSRGRKENTTVGQRSFAFGNDVEASGTNAFAIGHQTVASAGSTHAEGTQTTASGSASHAEGMNTVATGRGSHAEGINTTASGRNSHAEGTTTVAAGDYSHAEGNNNTAQGMFSHTEGGATYTSGSASHAEGLITKAYGAAAHAEGDSTIAIAAAQHVEGKYNIEDSYSSWAEWVANTEYTIGNKVKRTITENETTTIIGYICKTANSDAEFTATNWTEDSYYNFIHIVGNGVSDTRSNAYALDWDGTGHFAGDVYVHSNADSTGGNKLATEAYVTNLIAGLQAQITALQNAALEIDTGA